MVAANKNCLAAMEDVVPNVEAWSNAAVHRLPEAAAATIPPSFCRGSGPRSEGHLVIAAERRLVDAALTELDAAIAAELSAARSDYTAKAVHTA